MEEKEYSVSEAVREVGAESHVLRYWEEELSLKVRRSAQGHRIYSQKQIDLFRRVKKWRELGIQLKAIRVLLEDDNESEKLTGSLILAEPQAAQLRQFKAILKELIQEAVEEQNQKTMQRMKEYIRDEISDRMLEYKIAEKEAAVTKEKQPGMMSRIRRHILK